MRIFLFFLYFLLHPLERVTSCLQIYLFFFIFQVTCFYFIFLFYSFFLYSFSSCLTHTYYIHIFLQHYFFSFLHVILLDNLRLSHLYTYVTVLQDSALLFLFFSRFSLFFILISKSYVSPFSLFSCFFVLFHRLTQVTLFSQTSLIRVHDFSFFFIFFSHINP